MGNMSIAISDKTLKEAPDIATIESLVHLASGPCCNVHPAETGIHWKTSKRMKPVPPTTITPRTTEQARMNFRSGNKWR